MQQVAVRWQSKTFCKNIACHAGTTTGQLAQPVKADQQSVYKSVVNTHNIV